MGPCGQVEPSKTEDTQQTQRTLIVSDVIGYSEVGPYVLEKPAFNTINIISRSIF